MQKNIVIGICGGSGSGKTTLAKSLLDRIGEQNAIYLGLDCYYKDLHKQFDGDGGSINFDHPDSLDFDLLTEHLNLLRKNSPIEKPIYDFTTHSRKSDTLKINPKNVIVIEGILLFHHLPLRNLIDYKIFLDIDESLRIDRRITRDTSERGRCVDGAKKQIEKQVVPMHRLYVNPLKEFADVVFEDNAICVNKILEKIKALQIA